MRNRRDIVRLMGAASAAFVAVSCLADAGRAAPVLGYGAHLDAATAVLRAVTEHNQILAATTSPILAPRSGNGEGRHG